MNRVVPDAELDAAVDDLLRPGHPRQRRRRKALGKHAFYAQIDLAQDQAYAYAIEVMAAAALTADAQEGIASFLEKRRPAFRQR